MKATNTRSDAIHLLERMLKEIETAYDEFDARAGRAAMHGAARMATMMNLITTDDWEHYDNAAAKASSERQRKLRVDA